METTGNAPRHGARTAARPSLRTSVNDDIRRLSSNLAFVIHRCGLSQSELSRRSGLSRQLINGWACKRGSVSLSATVGQLLSVIGLTLADLLLDQESLARKLHVPPQAETDLSRILPLLARSLDDAARQRIAAIAGVFRYRTRLKESPMHVLERRFEIVPDGAACAVNVFEATAGNKPCASGNCFYRQSTFYLFAECTEPPHQPLIYVFGDPKTAEIMSLHGVSIGPGIGRDTGSPLTQLAYMSRNDAVSAGFDPEREFNSYIPSGAGTEPPR